MSLGNVLSANGVSQWLVSILFKSKMNLPIFLLGDPFITPAGTWRYSPTLLILPLVITVCVSIWVPIVLNVIGSLCQKVSCFYFLMHWCEKEEVENVERI